MILDWNLSLLHLLAFLLAHIARCDATEQYNFSPSSRIIYPQSVYYTSGNVTHSKDIAPQKTSFRLTGPNALVTFDFGQIVAGILTINIEKSVCNGLPCTPLGLPSFTCGTACYGLGVGFSESSIYAGQASDNSIFITHTDGTLYVPTVQGSYTLPSKWSRGSFRYLTLSLSPNATSKTSVTVQLDHVYFNAAPKQMDLRQYSGWFQSSDDLLNRIWYAGAYTLQLCNVAANSSIQHSELLTDIGWSSDAQATGLSSTDTYLSDGAKRDRNPWSGDLDVALKSALVSMNSDNLLSVKNALKAMFVLQDAVTGYFPYPGSPLGDFLILTGGALISAYGSDTYHLWTIVGFVEYVLASGDTSFGNQYWAQIVRGIEATSSYVDANSGLFNGTKTADWGRVGQGGQNTALNALYYHTLNLLAHVSTTLSTANTTNAAKWLATASKTKVSMNKLLYDPSVGLFFDNTTAAGHTLYPQDGNVAAINFNITTSPAQALTIANNLSKRLTRFGAPPPELPDSISPFISSQEIRAQFTASPADASRALKLMRTQWGYMMQAFSNETFVEGYGGDGGLGYGFYPGEGGRKSVSHAHGWSTGPVFSLLNNVVGIQGTSVSLGEGDGAWVFRPAVLGSGLSFAKGGYSTNDGEFEASWEVEGNVFEANVMVPSGLVGTVYVPTLGWKLKAASLDGNNLGIETAEGSFIRIANVGGGTHKISVSGA